MSRRRAPRPADSALYAPADFDVLAGGSRLMAFAPSCAMDQAAGAAAELGQGQHLSRQPAGALR